MSSQTTRAPKPREAAASSTLGEGWVSLGGVLTALGLALALSAFLLYTLWAFWPAEAGTGEPATALATSSVSFLGGELSLSADVVFFVVVAAAGALGAMVHTVRSLTWYVGNRKLRWSWMPHYALRPFLGGSLATLFYLVIRAGFFSPTAGSEQVSPYGFAALAALVGLFSDQALEKLREISNSVLTEVKPGEDHFGDDPGGAGEQPGEARRGVDEGLQPA